MPYQTVFLSDATTTAAVSRAVKRREVRKIGPRLYTTQVAADPADVIREHRWQIVGLYAPGAVIGYRTALEGRPATDGSVFLSGETTLRVDLPGLKIRVLPGAGPLDGDQAFVGGLYYASKARALLESLRPSRARQTVARGLDRARIEALLDRELELGNEEALNGVRDHAHRLASELEAQDELRQLDGMIGALLGSREGRVGVPIARGRLATPPYDGKRMVLFEELHATLVTTALPIRRDPAPDGAAFRNLAFLDAYFSNYIEGTELELDEAREVVFERRVLPNRPADSHDVLGTYQLVGAHEFLRSGVRALPDAAAFIVRLKDAHARIMSGRPENEPGRFKDRANRAGNTVFVSPEHVVGTLHQGFILTRALDSAFARAAALMFIIAEVHPFRDGNGRVARAMMNAELCAAGQCRILIPTVFRDDYLTALRALSRQGHDAPFVQVLDFAQRVTAGVAYDDLDSAIATLRTANAFDDPTEGTKLRFPEPR